ncbi:MAG: DNA repair protein RadC [Syntrophobacterales bacterium]|nr:DNA repair protein RadC [Syntrophobacterales bacterium]
MKSRENTAGEPPGCRTEEETIKQLAEKALFPVMSRRGKVYLHPAGRVRPTAEESRKIIEDLKIEDADRCRELRKRIGELRAASRESRPIRTWVKSERPRERLQRNGPETLTDSALLAIIVRTGMEGVDAEELGRRLINRFGSFRALDDAPISEICHISGIGPAKAVQVKAAIEIGKRLLRERAGKKRRVRNPSDIVDYVAEYYGPYLRDSRKEVFSVIFTDIKNKPLHHVEVSRGSVSASIVDPGEIIREASLRSASAVILIHNHPSGETEPSTEDIRLTRRIVEACSLLNIKVLDHIIIGKNLEDYYSFSAAGLIG